MAIRSNKSGHPLSDQTWSAWSKMKFIFHFDKIGQVWSESGWSDLYDLIELDQADQYWSVLPGQVIWPGFWSGLVEVSGHWDRVPGLRLAIEHLALKWLVVGLASARLKAESLQATAFQKSVTILGPQVGRSVAFWLRVWDSAIEAKHLRSVWQVYLAKLAIFRLETWPLM